MYLLYYWYLSSSEMRKKRGRRGEASAAAAAAAWRVEYEHSESHITACQLQTGQPSFLPPYVEARFCMNMVKQTRFSSAQWLCLRCESCFRSPVFPYSLPSFSTAALIFYESCNSETRNILRKWPLCAGWQARWKEGRRHMLQSGDEIGFVWNGEKSRECVGAPEGGRRRRGGIKTSLSSSPPTKQGIIETPVVWAMRNQELSLLFLLPWTPSYSISLTPPSTPPAAASLSGLEHNLFPRQKINKKKKRTGKDADM